MQILTVLGAHHIRAEGTDPLPWPAGNALPNAAQKALGLFCHLWPVVHQDPKVFHSSAFLVVKPQQAQPHRVISPQVQDFSFTLVECPESCFFPVLQTIHVTPESSTTIWGSSYFCVICKLAEGVFCSLAQVINEDTELSRIKYWPLSAVFVGFPSSPLYQWSQPSPPVLTPSYQCTSWSSYVTHTLFMMIVKGDRGKWLEAVSKPSPDSRETATTVLPSSTNLFTS